MSLERELKEVIVKDLKLNGVNPDDIQDEDALFGDGLGLDSLDAVELVVILQRHFQVEIKDITEARSAFGSIKSLADYIRENRTAE